MSLINDIFEVREVLFPVAQLDRISLEILSLNP